MVCAAAEVQPPAQARKPWRAADRGDACTDVYIICPMSRVHDTWRYAALAGLLALWAASSDAQPAVRQVLVLQSFDRGITVFDYLTGSLRV